MRKVFLALSLFCLFAMTSFAQTIPNDLEIEIDQLQNELKSVFQELDMFIGMMPNSVDSINFQALGLGDVNASDIEELLNNFMPKGQDVDLDKMMQQFQNEIQSLDLKEFDSILKQFGLDEPAIPAPDRLKDPKSPAPTKKKTERKEYSM